MQVIHRIDNFLYAIFPKVQEGDETALLEAISEFYSLGQHKPKVKVEKTLSKVMIYRGCFT